MSTLDLTACSVELARGLVVPRSGDPRRLTTREVDLLRYLTAHPSVPVPRDELLANVWGYSDAVVTRVCDNTVHRLREKIELDPKKPDHLITVHGTGYRFEPRPGAPARQPPPEPATVEPLLVLGPVAVDLGRARATGLGRDVELSGTEVALVRRLLRSPGVMVSRSTLLREVWGSKALSRAVDHAIHRLRTKLEADPAEPRFLLTAPGGYRFELPSERARPDAPIGRAALLDAVGAAVVREPWVLLVGPPGAGKTTLARAVVARGAREWVDCSRCASPVDLVAAVARSLQVPLAGDGGLDDLPPGTSRIGRALANRGQVLIVLDDLDPVVGLELVVDHWTQVAPGVRFLATSRTVVHRGEIFEVRGLDEEAAVDLFVRRAGSASREFRVDEGVRDEVRAVVRRLGGLPLAIELAAARTPILSLRALLDRLGTRMLDLLSALREELDATVAVLSDGDQEALVALSLFVGPFTAEDVEQVLGPDGLDRVQALRDHSLVTTRASGEARDDGEIEISVFPVVREYAAEQRLRLPDRGRSAILRHVRHLARLGDPEHLWGLDRRGRGADRARQQEAAEDLVAAARLALEVGEPELACCCAHGATWWSRRAAPSERMSALCREVLGAPQDRGALWGALSIAASSLCWHMSRFQEGERLLAEAEPVVEQHGSPRQRVQLHEWWASQRQAQGDAAGMRAHHEAALARAGPEVERGLTALLEGRRLAIEHPEQAERVFLEGLEAAGDHLGYRVLLLRQLTRLATRLGRTTEARDRQRQAIEVYEVLGQHALLPDAWAVLVHLAVERGDLGDAERAAREGLAGARRLGMDIEEALILSYLGAGEIHRGEPERAWENLSRARALLEPTTMHRTLGYTEMQLAFAAVLRGDPATGLALATRSSERNARIPDPWNQAVADSIGALALAALGRLDEARPLAESALERLLAHGDPHDQLIGWCRLSEVAAAQGDRVRATECAAQARALATTYGLGAPNTAIALALAKIP